MNEYEKWIAGYARAHGNEVTGVRGNCAHATKLMVARFPELRRVPGRVIGRRVGDDMTVEWTHWWCKTKSGTIVDPTSTQFAEIQKYIEHDGPIPLQRCYNCSEDVFDRKHQGCCSSRCEREYARYVSGNVD